MYISKKIKLSLVAFVVVGSTLISVVQFTDYCKLEVVTVNAAPIKNWTERYGLSDTQSLFKQPIDSLASVLLDKNYIYKVDIDYLFPNMIDIKTNNYNPVCFVLDRITKVLYGVNSNGRVVKLDNCRYDWNDPVLTSVSITKPFGFCLDYRVREVVTALQELRRENRDLYRLIDEIDFGNTGFLKVSVDGLSYRLKVRSDHLLGDIKKFVAFVSRFNPDLEKVKLLDLRYDDMIICAQGNN